ncbi:hypothetical protein [Paraliomyxa miuraensis]|uniref:hypothetical protein n=1 Tax=Paraliomyxa miuraensis TaxID=376150 RepID=UPI0022527DDE|nr:hypothetical protein [Paraliomyxa miuraensis]MCX4239642.1 hypothetical protein [Paraliomyxa miuraensis]
MSKWLWLMGVAGIGTVALAAGSSTSPAGNGGSSSGGGSSGGGGDAPVPGGGGGETPPPGGGGTPEPGGGPTLTPTEPKPAGPKPAQPWFPKPYDEYTRGPYTIDLTGLSTGVRWRVYATAEHPATETEKDAVKLGAGIEESDEDARVAANAYVDALGVLPVEPFFPMPPKPQPDPPGAEAGLEGMAPPEAGPAPGPLYVKGNGDVGFEASPSTASLPTMVQRHGLNVWDDCTRITVDSIVSWIAWAESWIRNRVRTTPRVRLVQGLLEASFPGCTWDLARVRVANGRSLLQQLAVVDAKYFAPVRAGKPSPPQSPWEPLPLERAVAELVGEKAPPVVPPELAYLGYHVDVGETPAGWIWKAWRRGKHEGAADLQGGPEKDWRAVVLAAKVSLTELPG